MSWIDLEWRWSWELSWILTIIQILWWRHLSLTCKGCQRILWSICTRLLSRSGYIQHWVHTRLPGKGRVCSSRRGHQCVSADTYRQPPSRCSRRRRPGHTGCWSTGQSCSWCMGLQCSWDDTCKQHCWNITSHNFSPDHIIPALTFLTRCNQHWLRKGWWSRAPGDTHWTGHRHSWVGTCTPPSGRWRCSRRWCRRGSADTGSGCIGQMDLTRLGHCDAVINCRCL